MQKRHTPIYQFPACASCDKVRAMEGIWLDGEDFLQEYTYVEFTPTVCPECAKRFFPHLCEHAAVSPIESKIGQNGRGAKRL